MSAPLEAPGFALDPRRVLHFGPASAGAGSVWRGPVLDDDALQVAELHLGNQVGRRLDDRREDERPLEGARKKLETLSPALPALVAQVNTREGRHVEDDEREVGGVRRGAVQRGHRRGKPAGGQLAVEDGTVPDQWHFRAQDL